MWGDLGRFCESLCKQPNFLSKDFQRLGIPPIDQKSKVAFSWRGFTLKTPAQYLKAPLNEGLIRKRLRKPLHRTWRPWRPSPDGVVTCPGRQTQCKGFLNLHSIQIKTQGYWQTWSSEARSWRF